jgi:IPT/TIG domain
MAERGDRPWLPGSYPEPGYPVHLKRPSAAALSVPGARAIVQPHGTTPPEGYYTVGLPNNIVQSLFACVEGENEQDLIREEYYRLNTPEPVVPTPVITTLVPPDAIASGTAPISLQVNGSDFQDYSKVWFNGVVMPTMYYDSHKLVAEVQKLAIGYYPVAVKTGDKTSNTLQFRFR